jgi:hypothetical protein
MTGSAATRDPYAAAVVGLHRRQPPFSNREHNAVWVPASAGTTAPIQFSNSERVCVRIPAAHFARVMRRRLPPPGMKREQGMPGARYTRGLVCNMRVKKTHTSIQVKRRHSGIPCAMVLRLTPCSPRRANSSCHRHPRIEGAPRPVGRRLPPRIWRQQRASGPHGFTVRDWLRRLARRHRSRGSSRPATTGARAGNCRVHHIPGPRP